MMELFAAVDVMDGRAVRLVKGEFGASRSFGDPLEVAGRFLAAGTPWLHVVDLDAARTGEPANRGVLLALADAAHRAGARAEVSGGLRDRDAVDALLAAGVDRVVLGTAAIEDPDVAVRLATRHPGRVAVGLDYRRPPDGALELALRGWTEPAAVGAAELLSAWAGVPFAAVVTTSIDRDGTREGPDSDGLSSMLDATDLPVVASGGVGSASDLSGLARLRSFGRGRSLAGAVVGRALVDGSMGIEEAIAACAVSG
ncbi:MAG TPA: 1-(5-phosphoribosyl)-5-[(5-phosphoribosylamino)methylideneamino] imidazole-4-carboxamide isomerase [Acidimicrobiales bacterium]|nr:1-(5-phosphoribosyl)-5-[(5-phosphoribosylamino)methylideneamino] imidazole-4-carboxamide isomerase [Acidimicrobiales bacterium]